MSVVEVIVARHALVPIQPPIRVRIRQRAYTRHLLMRRLQRHTANSSMALRFAVHDPLRQSFAGALLSARSRSLQRTDCETLKYETSTWVRSYGENARTRRWNQPPGCLLRRFTAQARGMIGAEAARPTGLLSLRVRLRGVTKSGTRRSTRSADALIPTRNLSEGPEPPVNEAD